MAKNIFDNIENKLLSEELRSKGEKMSEIYSKLYVIENTLRSFLEDTLSESLGTDFWYKLTISKSLNKSISAKRFNHEKNAWLPLRGDSDIYYTDFKDLGDIINNNWLHFRNYFPDQTWIISKINDLSNVRNLIAHNSYISSDESQLVDVYFRAILKQIRAITHSTLSEKQHSDDNHNDQFIDGLKKHSVYNYQEMFNGVEFSLDYPEFEVAPICLRCFFYQVHIAYYMVFKNTKTDITYLLATDLEIEASGEPHSYKNYCHYQLGQYDIDEDGVDEVLIAIQDSQNCSVQINILKYYPPALEQHAGRIENWKSIGAFKVENILGAPKVFIQKNSIKVPRNLRGFYHEWTWAKNDFVDTGFL